MPITLPALCLLTLVLCNVHSGLEHGIPRRSFLSRRAIDGTRGRKYFDPEEEGAFDSYGSAGGQYDPYQEKTDFSDIRRNVPGEPRIDYPAYTTLPQTGFTCEGRSRGYYADEVSGCQVFHVCHDVLVSSFLCPIGSIFSQKLLTCDWWTKVDCASSGKYTDVNRNSYQQDDDEMIRNAYAMISLQSGTDVTKDGLVDPDRTGSVVDYQRSPGRITDYSQVDATGNDLRSNFEDYPGPVGRDFQPPYRPKERKPETGEGHRGRFYSEGKSRSPYEDSPIIRVQNVNDPSYGNQQRNKNFHDAYARTDQFANRFQPSYAPTVPTVTTTTRRFYSPTVPTTLRHSTLAYNKLDQVIDSSDYYFSRSRGKSFVTPPTRVFSSSGRDRQDFGGVPSKKPNGYHDYARQGSYEDDYEEEDDSEETGNGKSMERFQVRVAEDYNFNRTGPLYGRNPFFDGVYRGLDLRSRAEEDVADDFETRGSIGLGQALRKSFRGIFVREQNPAKGEVKGDGKKEADRRRTPTEPESTNRSVEIRDETTEQYQRNHSKVTNGVGVSVSTTAPSVIESAIKASTSPRELLKPIDVKDPIDDADGAFHTHRPVTELSEPSEKSQTKFRIKVPDLSEVTNAFIGYSTLDSNPYPGTGTTELPTFRNTFSDDYVDEESTSFDKNVAGTSRYDSLEDSTSSSFHGFPTTVARPFVPSNSGNADVKATRRDYNDDSDGVAESDDEDSHGRHRSNVPFDPRSNAEEKLERNRKTPTRFDVDLNSKSPVSESTVSALKTVIKTTVTSSSSRSPAIEIPEENANESSSKVSSYSVINSSIVESSDSVSKSVTDRSIEESTKEISKDTVEASTVNVLVESNGPKSLKQIEETIEENDSPYRLTLTVNQEEDAIPTGGDSISKLIAEQGKEASTLKDRVHELEIIKSVEPEVRRVKGSEATTARSSDVKNDSKPANRSSVVDDLKGKRNLNTVSLLQLMSELLKLDKIPRPFSFADSQGSELRTRSDVTQNVYSTTSATAVANHLSYNGELQGETGSSFEKNVDGSESKVSGPGSKEQLLGELAENFGEPIYRKDVHPALDLSDGSRSVDFESELPLRVGINDKETNIDTDFNSSISTVPQTNSVATVAPSTRKTPLTTESGKTVVKTELVPSIGFSLDTDEGREEYAEAVLGGLIEPQAAESEKKETILKETVGEDSSSGKNETSTKN